MAFSSQKKKRQAKIVQYKNQYTQPSEIKQTFIQADLYNCHSRSAFIRTSPLASSKAAANKTDYVHCQKKQAT